MPEGNGLSVIDQLQKSAKNVNIPAAILTGEPHQKAQAETARQGVLDYIMKDKVNVPRQIL